jgi:hypothetical protein
MVPAAGTEPVSTPSTALPLDAWEDDDTVASDPTKSDELAVECAPEIVDAEPEVTSTGGVPWIVPLVAKVYVTPGFPLLVHV